MITPADQQIDEFLKLVENVIQMMQSTNLAKSNGKFQGYLAQLLHTWETVRQRHGQEEHKHEAEQVQNEKQRYTWDNLLQDMKHLIIQIKNFRAVIDKHQEAFKGLLKLDLIKGKVFDDIDNDMEIISAELSKYMVDTNEVDRKKIIEIIDHATKQMKERIATQYEKVAKETIAESKKFLQLEREEVQSMKAAQNYYTILYNRLNELHQKDKEPPPTLVDIFKEYQSEVTMIDQAIVSDEKLYNNISQHIAQQVRNSIHSLLQLEEGSPIDPNILKKNIDDLKKNIENRLLSMRNKGSIDSRQTAYTMRTEFNKGIKVCQLLIEHMDKNIEWWTIQREHYSRQLKGITAQKQ